MRLPFPALGLLFGPSCTVPALDFDTADASVVAVNWSGYVVKSVYGGDDGYLEDGSLVVEGLGQELVAEGFQPEPARSPGYWRVQVPPETPVALRVAGDGMIPSLWEATTPGNVGIWFSGALVAFEEASWMPALEEFDGAFGIELGKLDADHCWLFGVPMVPADWADAEISVVDGTGHVGRVIALAEGSDATLVQANGDPVVEFFSFNLAPGPMAIHVAAADGRTLDMVFPARGGELVTPWYIELPEAD
jgi:hypothetical protein